MPSSITTPIITVVCTANICRSPMAAALLAHALNAENAPLSKIQVQSAGVAAMDGEVASLNSVKALQAVGIDLEQHSSQQLTQEIVDQSLAILCMTESHRDIIRHHFDLGKTKLVLFREPMPGASIEIPDPYGMDLASYEDSRDSMVEALPSIVQWLKQEFPSHLNSPSK